MKLELCTLASLVVSAADLERDWLCDSFGLVRDAEYGHVSHGVILSDRC